MHQSRDGQRNNTTMGAQQIGTVDDDPSETCTVVPEVERPWWRAWARKWQEERHDVEVALVERIERTKEYGSLMRTDVQMNRWLATQIGLRRGSLIVLDRDVQGRINTISKGLCLRFARVTRIRRKEGRAVIRVQWRQYSDAGIQHETTAPRPYATQIAADC